MGENCTFIVDRDPIFGRYLKAKKDFTSGELIFCENSLVCGPVKTQNFAQFPPCLTCHKIVTSTYKCPSCQWSMCDENCAKFGSHAKFECPYIKGLPVECIKWIFPLRCVLLKIIEPEKWAELCDFQSNPSLKNSSNDFKNIFPQFNGLITSDDISRVLGIIRCNGFATIFPTFGGALFKLGCIMSHSCSPNARYEIMPSYDSNQNLIAFMIKVWATVPILKGQSITIQYTGIMAGTIERREKLLRNYGFDCRCSRCVDPTELGSNFSSLICQKCKSGNLLNTEFDKWKCDLCQEKCDFDENLKKNYLEERSQVGEEHSEENIQKFRKILDHYSGIYFHANHYYLVEIRNEIIKRSFSVLKTISHSNQVIKDTSDLKEYAEILTENCKFLVNILNYINPGQNRMRARLLCLQLYGQLWLRLLKVNHESIQMDKKFRVIEKILNFGDELIVYKTMFSLKLFS